MVEIEIEGGAMIGYCATASSGIEIAPIKQMKSATTQAKIGLSIKKLGMFLSQRDACVVGESDIEPTEASASIHALDLTLSPGTNFWNPSTITRSPSLRPSLISQTPSCTAPVRTG